MSMIKISKILIADRHRRDDGDIDSLAESLREIGQLQPIVITSDLRLVAGGRRLAAAQSLGWTEIEAKVAHDLVAAEALLRAERDENTCRKAFTPTEEYSLYEALLALQAPPVTDVPVDGHVQREDPDVSSPKSGPSTRDRQSVAEIVTGSAGRHKTLEKIGEVKRIAEDQMFSEQLRQKARDALTEMDLTGNISGPHMRVNLAVKAELTRKNSDMSNWSEEERSLLKQLRAGHTVIVSLRDHHANLVRWAQAEGCLVAVDRRTEWGNPFEMPYDGDRDTVIRNYAEHYLPYKPSLLSRLPELRGKALACWCAPDACHADVLKRKAEELRTD
jgi:Domain of unknown function (DUF4326)/ParB-like nuclease domain